MSRGLSRQLGWRWACSSWRLPTTWAAVGGVAFAVYVAISAIALWQGNADRLARGAAQEPRHAVGDVASFEAQIRSAPYSDDVLTTIMVSRTGAGAPVPPGVSRFPKPGEVWVSPQLAQAITDSPELATSFPGTVVGEIGSDGLQSPDQLFALVGVTAAANKGSYRAAGWGSASPTNDRAVLPAGPFFMILMLLVALPLLMFGRTIAGLAAEGRRRRVASLHLLGVPRRVLVRAVGLDTAVKASLGAGIGAVLAVTTVGALARQGLLGLAWFPAETIIPISGSGIAVSLILAAVVGTAARDVATSLKDPLQARAGRETQRPAWRWAPVVIGLGLLVGLQGQHIVTGVGSADSAIYLLYGGAALALLGSAFALTDIVRGSAILIPAQTRRTWLFVAKQRLANAPEPVARAASAIVIVVSVGLVGLAAIDDVKGLDSPSPLGDQLSVTLSGTAGPAGQRSFLHTRTAARMLRSPEELGAGTIATCADLVAIARQDSVSTAGLIMQTCRDGRTYTFLDPTDARPQPIAPGSQPIELPDLVRTALSSGLVQAREPTARDLVRGAGLVVYLRPSSTDAYVAAVLRSDPLAGIVDTGHITYHAMIPTIERTLSAGIAAGLLIGLATLVLTMVDAGRTGAKEAAVQRALGASRRHLSLAEAAQYAVGFVAALAAGLVVGGLIGAAYLTVGATGASLLPDLLALAFCSILAIGLVIAIMFAFSTARREPQARLLRRD